MPPVSPRTPKRPVAERSAALCRFFARLLASDTARITQPTGALLFLVLGFRRNTRDDGGVWVNQRGERRDWDYIHETVAVSAATVRGLIAEAHRYKRLTDMGMLDYLRELHPDITFPDSPDRNHGERPVFAFAALPA